MTQTAPLAGIRVIEISHMVMGPSAGMFLAFLGAEVIKIEPPGGDKTRDLTGMGAGFFPTFNRGKKSVTLDLKSDADLARLHDLLAGADVFVENFRDETLAAMGLAPDALRARHPGLIVTSCKGFLHGPYAGRAAMDEVVQMMTGMAYMTGPRGRPLRIGSSANDIMAGLFAAFSVLAALIARGRSGQGAALRVGLFENCLLLVAQHMVQFEVEGTESPPMPERDFSWPVYDLFTTRDGRQIFIGAATDGQWQKLCGALGLEDLLSDPDLQTRPQQIAARDRFLPRIAAVIRGQDQAELIAICDRHHLLYAPVARPTEMFQDPHVCRPGGLVQSDYPDKRAFRAPGLPIEIDAQPLLPGLLDVPSPGQHNAEVLGRQDGVRARHHG